MKGNIPRQALLFSPIPLAPNPASSIFTKPPKITEGENKKSEKGEIWGPKKSLPQQREGGKPIGKKSARKTA
jgi:hypothetical protein